MNAVYFDKTNIKLSRGITVISPNWIIPTEVIIDLNGTQGIDKCGNAGNYDCY